MTDSHTRRAVPTRALAISLLSFVVPVAAVFAFPDGTSSGLGTLVWLPALIPPFLLAYYRGLRGVAVALAGGMAVVTATQLSVAMFEIGEPRWTLLLAIVLVYLVVSVGIGLLAEVFRRDRHSAEALALVDRLTGLPNRRHLDLTLESAFAAAERGHAVSVVLFDIDHFKRVNDTYGHPAGDTAIRALADVLRANTRRQDLAARFGGDEFVCVLRDGDEASSMLFAQRVLQQMQEKSFPWGHQTLSAGIAVHAAGMGSHEVLLAAADRALYTSKSAGRNRATVAMATSETSDRTAERERIAAKAPLEPQALTPVQSRLFVVDDDREIRDLLRLALEPAGYSVWDTDDPREAVQHFAGLDPSQRPHAIITDVIMPSMTGMTMIEQIAAVEPALRVVYMSGYIRGEVTWAGVPGATVVFLEKPFTLDTLRATVRELLQRDLAR